MAIGRRQGGLVAPAPRVAPVVETAEPSHGSRLTRWVLGFDPFVIVLLGAAVFLLAYVAVTFAPVDNGVAAWWPAAGLSVLAVAWAPRRRRLGVVLTVAVASGVANAVAGRDWPLATGFGLSNKSEAK
uniref:hypothetical protein n=1 Tax=Actinotalea sp. C106 TaxID=2908644 RepID=UPI002028414B